MVDRRWPRDLALAVLLAIPLSMLAEPRPVLAQHKPASFHVSLNDSDRLAGTGRVSLIDWS